MTTIRVIAHRNDGKGFLVGRIVGAEVRHGRTYYGIKAKITGRTVKISDRDYTLTPVS